MNNIKLLAELERKSLHVHVLTAEDRKSIGTMSAYDPRHSHFVMYEGDVVHCGTPSSVEWFAYQFKEPTPPVQE